MTVAIKGGVRLHGLRPEMLVALQVADGVFSQFDPDQDAGAHTVVTSGIDGRHSWGSLHYQGAALDFRTRHLTEAQAKVVVDVMGDRLGDDYDVILESNHIHCELQPKEPY